ncbi:YfiT family bacillithiol transferase [Mucilaginibacter sp. KACC 22063]|uniref:YfiT family bacillithiol transferase n=1 Tax=Mucilaginibacter sp. KACC 22063 TaxID=3025666 RepID=UPI002365E2BB|nr:putative metal-dependent hydrolase [Mucilaginibacter sp. KACC 22063]WDF55357.1 putative metal-dependent hydrolase [Mucilaginibacter sp. KACC 22063]
MSAELEQLKYPIGRFTAPETYSTEAMQTWINEIRVLPSQIRKAVTALNGEQLNTPYRPDGWTIKQVVHHLADSHMNSLIRFKWTLTEQTPTIKAYHEAEWAKLPDYQLPVESSLIMLEGIHQHMVALFEALSPEQWELKFIHPQQNNEVPLKRNLALYAWHGKHHLQHILNTFKQ